MIRQRALAAPATLVAVLALAGATLAAAQPAADPFYLGLLREGRTSLARGDAARAAKELRVACFGLLDQPPLLGECLVRLALAQGELGDRDAFGETFDRIEAIEERFQAYTLAALSPEERKAFEDRALDWIAPEILRTLPSFAPRLARRAEESLAKLAPRERQRELERRAAAEPGNPRWRVLLAEEEVAKERWKEALERLKGVAGEAEAGRAGCLSGLALARLERCTEALPPLAACAATQQNAALAEARLGCHVETRSLDAGRAFAATLDPKVASAPAIKKLQEKLSPKERAEKPEITASQSTRTGQDEIPPAPAAKKPADKTPSPAKGKPAATFTENHLAPSRERGPRGEQALARRGEGDPRRARAPALGAEARGSAARARRPARGLGSPSGERPTRPAHRRDRLPRRAVAGGGGLLPARGAQGTRRPDAALLHGGLPLRGGGPRRGGRGRRQRTREAAANPLCRELLAEDRRRSSLTSGGGMAYYAREYSGGTCL